MDVVPISMDETTWEYEDSYGIMRNIVFDGWTKGWKPEKSEKHLEN